MPQEAAAADAFLDAYYGTDAAGSIDIGDVQWRTTLPRFSCA
jgi:hypothetical protein